MKKIEKNTLINSSDNEMNNQSYILEFSNRLKKYKDDNGLNNKKISELLSTSEPKTSNILNNYENQNEPYTKPTIENIISLSKKTGISTDYWLGLVDDKEPKKDGVITYKQLLLIFDNLVNKKICQVIDGYNAKINYAEINTTEENYNYSYLGYIDDINYQVNNLIIRDDLFIRLVKEYNTIKSLKNSISTNMYNNLVNDFLKQCDINIDEKEVCFDNNILRDGKINDLKSGDIIYLREYGMLKSDEIESDKSDNLDDFPFY